MWILEVAENCVLSSLKFHVSVFHGAPRGSHAHFIKHEKCWLTQACHRGDEKGRSGITTRLCNARWLAIPNPLLSRLQDWMTIPSVCYFQTSASRKSKILEALEGKTMHCSYLIQIKTLCYKFPPLTEFKCCPVADPQGVVLEDPEPKSVCWFLVGQGICSCFLVLVSWPGHWKIFKA